MLQDFVEKYGNDQWHKASFAVPGRCAKQCRERYMNNLNPEVKKGNWTQEEDFQIFKLYNEIGPRWSQIAKNIPERTENSIKNRFYSSLRKIVTEKKRKVQRSQVLETEVKLQGLEKSSLNHIPALADSPQQEKELQELKERAILDVQRRKSNNFLEDQGSLKMEQPSSIQENTEKAMEQQSCYQEMHSNQQQLILQQQAPYECFQTQTHYQPASNNCLNFHVQQLNQPTQSMFTSHQVQKRKHMLILLQQIDQLEVLLNQTKQELNKLEGNIEENNQQEKY